MVVETTQDLAAYEKKNRKYDGVYHVLHGAISPMLGIGPDDIRLKRADAAPPGRCLGGYRCHELQPGGRDNGLYISKLIKPTGIKVSRIASGVPVGGDLEYIDEVTLLRALEGRTGALNRDRGRENHETKKKSDIFGCGENMPAFPDDGFYDFKIRKYNVFLFQKKW